MSADAPLLEIDQLSVAVGPVQAPVPAVQQASLHIGRGEAVGLVGESGCGKSLTALAIGRLLPRPSARQAGGVIRMAGCDLGALSESAMRAWRGRRIAYVFQEPAIALNPVHSVGAQILEALRVHRPAVAVDGEVERLLAQVGLPDPARVRSSYPHQLSGGMQQRVMLAMALAGEPDLLIADEPTTALDVTVQAQIMELLLSLQRKLGMALLLITHHLGLVARATTRLYVMYAGRLIEQGPTREVLTLPAHPYTRALLRAVPRLHGAGGSLQGIPGSVPQGRVRPAGCAFHPRCERRQPRCVERIPVLETVSPGHEVCCHFWR